MEVIPNKLSIHGTHDMGAVKDIVVASHEQAVLLDATTAFEDILQHLN
jgi:hypothetical protein